MRHSRPLALLLVVVLLVLLAPAGVGTAAPRTAAGALRVTGNVDLTSDASPVPDPSTSPDPSPATPAPVDPAGATSTFPFAWKSPVRSAPAITRLTAGGIFTLRFTLGGDRGMGILAAGFPVSQRFDCTTGRLIPLSRYRSRPLGRSGLGYDAASRTYRYAWQTREEWSNTCRRFTLMLTDGSTHTADVRIDTFRFIDPTARSPRINDVRPGAAVPVRFHLGASARLDIWSAPTPRSRQVDCATGDPLGAWSVTDPAGAAGLTRNAARQDYTYRWQTDAAWAQTCRAFEMRMKDGTVQQLRFRFNRPPVAVADGGTGFTTDQSVAFTTATVLDNDTDPDNDPLTITAVDQSGLTGTLTDNADGTFDYDPGSSFDQLGQGESDTDSFGYTIADPSGATDSATVTITVNGLNDTPVIDDQNRSVAEDAADGANVGIPLAFSDTDTTDTHTLAITAGNTGGAFAIDDTGQITVADATELDAGATPTYSLTVEVTDSASPSASDTATITVTVTDVNRTPVAKDTSPEVTEDTKTQITLTATDADDDDLTFSVPSTSTNGATIDNPGTVDCTTTPKTCTRTYDYTPVSNATAADSFTFTVSDGVNTSAAGTVSITITPVNDAPVLDVSKSPSLGTLAEDAPVPSGAVGVLVSSLVDFAVPPGQVDNVADVDSGAQLGIAVHVYDVGQGTLYYSLNDGTSWTQSGTRTRTNALLLAADSDNRVYYRPNANLNGTITQAIGIRAWDRTSGTDGETGVTVNAAGATGAFSTAEDNVALTVTAVNDAPTVTTTTGTVSYGIGGSPVVIDGGLTVEDIDDTDLEGALVAITGGFDKPDDELAAPGPLPGGIVASYAAAAGELSLSGTASVADYQAALRLVTFANTDPTTGTSRTLTFTVTDGSGTSADATRSITVLPNQAPTAIGLSNDTVAENQPADTVVGTFSTTDPDVGDTHSYTLVTGTGDTDNGSFSITGSSLKLGVVADFENRSSYSIRVRTTDSGTGALSYEQVFTITITNTNDAPVLNVAASPALADQVEDAAAPGGVVGTLVSTLVDLQPPAGGLDNVTDVDASAVTGIAVIGAATANGSWFYSIDNGVNWNALGPVTGTSARLLAADAGSRLYFRPTADFNGTITAAITFRAWDRTSGTNGALPDPSANGGTTAYSTATDTASLVVTAVDDAPVAQDKPTSGQIAVQANMKRTGIDASLLAGVTDADSGVGGCTPTFSVASITASTGGSVSAVNLAAGTFDFTPTAGFTGAATVSYTVSSDGCPGPSTSLAKTITLTVSGPVIWFVNPAAVTNGDGTLSAPFNTLAGATTAMGATTNQRIFLFSGTSASGTSVTLPADGWLVGQGATGTSFDSVMGITPPTGTITRPTINGTAPVVQGTVHMNGNNARVQGLRIQPPSASAGLVASLAGPFTGISVSDIPNITTTSARAVDLRNVSGTVSIQAVNASGSDIGINLSNVNPSSGSFTVVGTGGSCTATTPTCTGGTISNATDAGIKLNNARGVSLNRMRVLTSANFGLSGVSVTNLEINTSLFAGTHGDALDEGAIFVTNWAGTGAITDSEITGGSDDNIRVVNTTGSLNRLTISGSTIRNTTGASAHDGLHFAHGCSGSASGCSGAVMNLTVTGSTFKDDKDDHIDVAANGLGAMDVVLTSNTFQTTDSTLYGGSVITTVDHSADLTFDHTGNTSTGAQGTAFGFENLGTAQATASMTGRFRSNTIGTSGVAGSASSLGNGLSAAVGGGSLTMSVTGNTIRNYGGAAGMDFSAGGAQVSAAVVNLTVTGNTLNLNATPFVNQLHGLHVNMGTTSTGPAITACVDIGGAGALVNNLVGSSDPTSGGAEIRFRQRNTSAVRLPGLSGTFATPSEAATAAATYLAGRNTLTSSAAVSTSVNTSLSGGAACVQP